MIQYKVGTANDIKLIYESYSLEFPEYERKTREHLIGLLEGDDYELLIAEEVFENRSQRVGFAFVYVPKGANFVWLDYLVIDRAFQNKGYGSVFFNALSMRWKNRKGLFIEVEIPTNNNINQLRRISYYERLGAKKLPIAYYFPTTDGAMPMYLYFKKQLESYEITEDEVKTSIKLAHGKIHSDHENLQWIFDKMEVHF